MSKALNFNARVKLDFVVWYIKYYTGHRRFHAPFIKLLLKNLNFSQTILKFF